MGNSPATQGSNSVFDTISDNEYLKRLCGTDAISVNDPFWNALLAYHLSDTDLQRLVSKSQGSHVTGIALENIVTSFLKSLTQNNSKTRNFQSLLRSVIRRLDEVALASQDQDDGYRSTSTPKPKDYGHCWQIVNGLFLIRSLCKRFVEDLSEEIIAQQFLQRVPDGSCDSDCRNTSVISEFLCALCKGLTSIPVCDSTTLLHFEIINILITLLAIAMYDVGCPANNMFYIEIMEHDCSLDAIAVTHRLLHFFVHSNTIEKYTYRDYGNQSSFTSALWSVVTLGIAGDSGSSSKTVSLGTQSLLLLHILVNHPNAQNPYRSALAAVGSDEAGVQLVNPQELYDSICSKLDKEYTLLLLYKLLHENQMMKAFILSRTDTEKLTEPLLQVLYNDNNDNSHQVYLALIVLLILSEDDTFNKDLFQTNLPSLKWYKERSLFDITLGDAFLLTILRMMHNNLASKKDGYLHTNCLATLANVSSKFTNLHPYVCQRLIGYFLTLIKQHTKTKERFQLTSMKYEKGSEEEKTFHQLQETLGAIEEMIRMFFEIINSCITHTAHLNVHLIHVMLCHRDEFLRFKKQESFKHILQNITYLLDHFHSKLEEKFGEQPRSVEDVLLVIEDNLKTFRRGSFLKFPDLKFKYIEETDPSKFFVPYIWQIVCKLSDLNYKHPRFKTDV